MPRWGSLATLEEIQKRFENVAALQEHLNRVVIDHSVKQGVDGEHYRSEVSKLELHGEIEQLFLILLCQVDKW